MDDRLTPFDAVFGELADQRFPALRAGLAEAGLEPTDRDAFILARPVVELLRELAPEQGLGEGVHQLVGFLHACYLFWSDGRRRVILERASLDRLLGAEHRAGPSDELAGASYYLDLPARRVWGTPTEGGSIEPLEGCFVIPRGDRVEVIAVFGLHPGREGLTVVEASGRRPAPAQLGRGDGAPPFAPSLPGGVEAGLFEVAGEADLLELVYRCHALLGAPGAGADPIASGG